MNGFELNVSIPADGRFAETVAVLATHAAYHAGCNQALAAEFGAAVDAAVRGCVAGPPRDPFIGVVFRHVGSEIEAVLSCGDRIRIARSVPMDV